MTDITEELWQAYDERGEAIAGKGLTKTEAHAAALHAAAHVWIWRRRGESIEILLQRRARGKHTWPGRVDISAAGHVDLGELPLAAAIRETAEEIGLTLKPEDLKLLFVHRVYLTVEGTNFIENEFQWVYGLQVSDLGDTYLQEAEVEALEWVSLATFKRIALPPPDETPLDRIVPHGEAYFTELLKEIARLSP